ncbi:MAG TPA: sigma-70 family RNA polymerase sigma factor [Actinomycetota bacterium]|nr:sigma-70 family RNA polymerase sigma factor [Actinomycetota bacterium]
MNAFERAGARRRLAEERPPDGPGPGAKPKDKFSQLVFTAQLGDRDALHELIADSVDDVRRLCSALVDGRAADDLVQETYARVIQALRNFRGDSSARTWVLAVARYVCMDELRSRVRCREGLGRLSALAREEVSPDAAEESGVRELLSHLDPDRRAAFVLTSLLGMTYQEAGALCGCPTGTIRSRVARARDDLANLLRCDESAPAAAGGQPSCLKGDPGPSPSCPLCQALGCRRAPTASDRKGVRPGTDQCCRAGR